MSFLSQYEGNERIWLDDAYWVDVKKCLSHAEKQHAYAKLGAGKQTMNLSSAQAFAEMDPNSFETELIVQSLAAWNLDDKDGLLPLDAGGKFAGRGDSNAWPPGCPRRQSVARLPAPVTSLLFMKCNELNGPMEARAAASFPDPPGDGSEGRDAGAAGTGVLPDQGGVLEAAGGDEGEPGDPAVA